MEKDAKALQDALRTLAMISKKEIQAHLTIALEEVGAIRPWFDKKFRAWIFSHKKYPDVEYAGDSEEEVVHNYPKYLKEFIKHRLDDNIDPRVEKVTRGRAGRPYSCTAVTLLP